VKARPRSTETPATSKNAGLIVTVPTVGASSILGAGRPSISSGRRPTPNGGMLVVNATCSAPGMPSSRGCSRS
jgi:hypothetical protein